MNAPLWFHNLAAYSVQVALLVAAGELLPRLFRMRVPRALLEYWQLVLAACLALPVLQPWQRVPFQGAAGAFVGSVRLEDAARGAAARFPSLLLYEIAGLCLLAGVAVRLVWLAIGLWRLHFYRRRARGLRPLPPPIEEMCSRLGVSAGFYISSDVGSPVTCGEVHPAVLLPARFEEMSVEYQKAVACHELWHVRRHDWAFHLGEEIVRALFWFHPAVWWLISRIRLAREQVVDGDVLRSMKSRRPYLEALLEIATGQEMPRPIPAPLFLAERQLPQRITAMLKEVSMSKPRLIASLLGISSLLVLFGGVAVWSFPLRTQAQVSSAVLPGDKTPAAPRSNQSGESSANAPASGSKSLDPNPTPEYASAFANPTPDLNKNKSEKIYKVGGDVTAPVPIYKPEPPYTPEAKKAKLQGSVVLGLTIDASGNVRDVRVKQPLGEGLTESAVNTVRTWKFRPATKNGKPVPVAVVVEITFKLF